MVDDHLKEGLDILFIGFNPSLLSGQTGHHYASPNNRFWKILYESGITSRKFSPEEDYLLPKIGLGLTNIVERPTKAADEITGNEYKEGRDILKKKIERYRPLIACFVGKGVYQEFSLKREVHWGVQETETVPGVNDFVAPSSSGLVRMKVEDIIEIYKELPLLASRLKGK